MSNSFENFVIGVILFCFVELVERGTLYTVLFFCFEFLLEELFYSMEQRMFRKVYLYLIFR